VNLPRQSTGAPPKILTQSRAIYCFVINQTATPGLGSLLGRRFVVGTFQLLLALAGFVLLMGWIGKHFWRSTLQAMGEPVATNSITWMAKWGALFFGAAWIWALFTSFSLLRQAKDI
jgi:hypothetical protein